MVNNQAILERAITKAIEGGWKGVQRNGYYYPKAKDLFRWRWEESDGVWSDGEYETYEELNPMVVIFNQDFAKALWGEEIFENIRDDDGVKIPYYKYMLQQMVIANDPIAYLGDNI